VTYGNICCGAADCGGVLTMLLDDDAIDDGNGVAAVAVVADA
jgi:hypothetical protein